MRSLSTSALIFLSLINLSFGAECHKEKAAKERVIRDLKQIPKLHDLIVGSRTLVNAIERTCVYEVIATYKGLDDEGKEQIFMEYFKMNDDLLLLQYPPTRLSGERIKD